MVLLDNQTTMQALRTGISNSSQQAIEAFTALCQRHQDLKFRWIPDYNETAYNKKVNVLARPALSKSVSNLGTLIINLVTDFRGHKLTFTTLNRYLNILVQEKLDSW